MTMKREGKGWLGIHNDATEAEAQMATISIGYVISRHKLLSCPGVKGKEGQWVFCWVGAEEGQVAETWERQGGCLWWPVFQLEQNPLQLA